MDTTINTIYTKQGDKNITTGYGFTFTDNKEGATIKIDDYVLTQDDANNAVKVYLDIANAQILVKKGENTDKTYKLTTNCNCNYKNISECDYLWEQTARDTEAKGHEFTDPKNYFYAVVKNDPCVLKDLQPNPFYGVEIEMDWAAQEKYFKIIFLGGMGIVLAPMAVEIAVQAGVTVTTELVIQKSVEFTIGATVDGTIQVLVAMALDGKDFETATKELDYKQMFISGAENVVNNLFIEAGISCLNDGLLENGKIKENLKADDFISDCIIGAISAIAADKAAEKATKGLKKKIDDLAEYIRKNPQVIRSVFSKMGIPENKIDDILKKFGIDAGLFKNLDNVLTKLDNLELPNLKNKFDGLDDAAKARLAKDISGLDDDFLRELEDNFGLIDEWKKVDALDEATQNSKKPEWLKKIQQGNEFNKIRASAYPNNEVYLVNPKEAGRKVRLDSYIPEEEIVSRKYTQLADIEPSTGVKYIQELGDKYPPGRIIADVASNQADGANKSLKDMIGKGISGDMILEVPVQNGSIPKEVLNEAEKYGIIIRDILGKTYN